MAKKNLIVLFSQSREVVYILNQKEDLKFALEQIIKILPEYGLSWGGYFGDTKTVQ